MGRRPRIHYPGAVYHAMARGVDGRDVFIDDHDRREFLRSLNRIKLETNTVIYAHCLMGNHFHLALKVSTVPLSSLMQRILTGYSIMFNRRHDRTGHLFQARYKSVLCLDDRYLLSLIRYIQMNPVRAGLVEKAADWPWSSRSPVELPDLDADGFDPWPKDAVRPALLRPQVEQEWTLEKIGETIAAANGIKLGALRARSKSRPAVNARVHFAQESVRRGYRLGAIAAWLNAGTETVSYYLRKNLTNLQA